MAAARSWDPRSNASARSREPDEEVWHVEIEPGEIKVISLEQLDDLYRLDIISESTRLWQPGLRGWTRLGIVAGIEPEPAAVAQQLLARQTTNAIPPPPPPTPLRATPTPAPSGASDDWIVSLPPLSSLRPVSLGPPVATAPVQTTTRAPDSLRPLALNDLELPVPRRRGGGGWLVALAVLSGLGITLYRNDVLRQTAHRYGQDRIYTRLEAAVGAPGFGTLRSLEQTTPEASLASLNAAASPAPPPSITPSRALPSPAGVALTGEIKGGGAAANGGPISVDALALEREKATTAPAAPTPAKSSAGASKQPENAAPAKERKQPEKVAAAKVEKPASPSTEVPAPTQPSGSKGALLDAIRQSAKGSSKPAAAPRSPRARAKPADIGIKGSRHEYDPLNPKL